MERHLSEKMFSRLLSLEENFIGRDGRCFFSYSVRQLTSIYASLIDVNTSFHRDGKLVHLFSQRTFPNGNILVNGEQHHEYSNFKCHRIDNESKL